MPDGPNGLTTKELVLELREEVSELGKDLRHRFHDLRSTLQAFDLRLRNLEEFQRLAEQRFREGDAMVERYIPKLEHLLSEENFAQRMREARSASLTGREKAIGIVAGCCVVITAIVAVSNFVFLHFH